MARDTKEQQYLRQKLRQRINRIRHQADKSQVAVNQFDNWVDIYNKMGQTFAQMSDRRFEFMTKELERIDNLTTSTSKGASEYQKSATTLWGEDYNNLSTDEQSAIWEKFNNIRNEHPDLDSEQVKILSNVIEQDSNISVATTTDQFGNTQAIFKYKGKPLDRRLKETRLLETKLQNYDTDDYISVLYKAINRR